jgi:Flp pilus assembly pilin Flp
VDQKGGKLKHAASRSSHGVEYAVLSGIVACLLVLGASVYGSEIAAFFGDGCDDCVVAVHYKPAHPSDRHSTPADR